MRFILCSNPDNLREALAGKISATVEAEYGDVVVEGSALTLAHHGPRSGNPAPCLAMNCIGSASIEVVGLSHIDLDALGGCAAIMGRKPFAPGFWRLAAFVDTNGAHRLSESPDATEPAVDSLYAFWAWSQEHRLYPPRDGSALDVTKDVWSAVWAIERILHGDADMLAAGDDFRAAETQLNAESFLRENGGVIVREHDSFVNHLYSTPLGFPALAVVARNSKTGAITVSFAETPAGVSAREIVQRLWGPEAGGHDGIAGSPRDRQMTAQDLEVCVTATRAALA